MKRVSNLLKFKIKTACILATFSVPGQASEWQWLDPPPPLDLSTPGDDNTGNTKAYALSDDGSVVAGNVINDSQETRATIWTGENYTSRTDLGTLNQHDNSGNSYAQALSADGSIVVGKAQNETKVFRAIMWSGVDFTTKTDLGTLRSDNSGSSWAYAISADGSIVAGNADNDAGESHAAIWSGTDYTDKIDLGTLKNDNSGTSIAQALSTDGNVVAGAAENEFGGIHATVWLKDNHTNPIDLGTLKSDNSGNSHAYALSADGSVVAGSALNELMYSHAAVWSGVNYADKIDLGTLKTDNSGSSIVQALSADGSVAAGSAHNDLNVGSRAVVWSGAGYAIKTDLGTLKTDNSGTSWAYGISADGSVITGYAQDDVGFQRATLWKVLFIPPVDPGTPTPPVDPVIPEPPPVVVKVDTWNTMHSIARLGQDTFQTAELQRQGLIRMQGRYRPLALGETYYALHSSHSSQAGTRDTSAGVSLAYGLSDNLAAGLSLDHSLARSMPASYADSNDSAGFGLSAQWQQPLNHGAWFIRSAVSANQYQVDVTRPLLSNTEAGTGRSKIKGHSITLEGGQRLKVANSRFGWNTGLRYSDIARAGYTENNAAFPVTYSKFNYRSASAFIGASWQQPIVGRLSWANYAQLEQDIAYNQPTFVAHGEWLGGVANKADISHTRGNFSSGLVYSLSPKMQLSVMPSIGHSALGNTVRGVDLRISGYF